MTPASPLHREIAEAGAAAALGASGRLAELRSERGERLTVTIARRELRAWLRGSAEGAAVEGAVERVAGGLVSHHTCIGYNFEQDARLPALGD